MGSFKIEIEINKDTRTVFRALSDVRAMPRWYEAIKQVVALTANTSGVGARFEVGRVLPGGPVRNEVVIVEDVANELFTIESVSGPTPFRYRYTLEPVGQRTRLQLEGNITGEGLPGPLAHIDALTTQLFKRGMGENLRKLAEMIETP